jgi:hypothetical protein
MGKSFKARLAFSIARTFLETKEPCRLTDQKTTSSDEAWEVRKTLGLNDKLTVSVSHVSEVARHLWRPSLGWVELQSRSSSLLS